MRPLGCRCFGRLCHRIRNSRLAQSGLFTRWRKLAVLAQDADQLAVNLGVTGQTLFLFQKVGFAGEVAHQATGLGHQQRARGHVPGLQALFKETFGVTGGHIGQVQRGGAGAAQAGGALHHVTHHLQVLVEVVARAERKAGGNQGFLQLGALGDAHAAVVQVRRHGLWWR